MVVQGVGRKRVDTSGHIPHMREILVRKVVKLIQEGKSRKSQPYYKIPYIVVPKSSRPPNNEARI